MNEAGSKRKASAPETAGPAKRPANALAHEEGSSVLVVSEQILDVFQFLRRQELDTLQIVSARFNEIVENKLALVCLRQLNSAKISRCSAQNQFVLVMDEVGAKKKIRLPTGVDDETEATILLLNACRSSSVGSLQLYGTTTMSADFFDSLALSASTIVVKAFDMGRRTLSEDVADDKVLQVMQAFADLKVVKTESWKDVNLRHCLIRTCFKAGVGAVVADAFTVLGDNAADIKSTLLDFCFGACDEQFATRERHLRLGGLLLPPSFLQRWVEKAEVHNCSHKLTLDVTVWAGTCLPQDTAALTAYEHDHHTDGEQRFESITDRHWVVTYGIQGIGSEHITFAINH